MIPKPWRDLIPNEDAEGFRDGFEHEDRPLTAGHRPAVVVVDMTRQFVDSAYPTGWSRTGRPAVVANRELLDAARATGIPVFFTKAHVDPNYVETPAERGRWKTSGRRGVPEGTPPGDVIVDELAPIEGEVVIYKGYKPSAFYGTSLTSLLIYAGVDTVIVTGMTTSGCVRATVLDAFMNNLNVVVPYECVADRSQVSHKVNLFDMHMKYADVIRLTETLDYLVTVHR
ncbi:MAG: isochorismatase family protein [Acidimicrobiales bacterium]